MVSLARHCPSSFLHFLFLGVFLILSPHLAAASSEPSALGEISDSELVRLIQKAPSAFERPNARLMILLMDQKVFQDEEGGNFKELHLVLKIFKETAQETVPISDPYSISAGKPEILLARMFDEQGNIHALGSRVIQELPISPKKSLYQDLRILQLILPKTKSGNVIEVKARSIILPQVTGNAFSDIFYFPRGVFIQKARLTIDLLRTQKLHYLAENLVESKPEITQVGDRIQYQWEMSDLFLLHDYEPQIPPTQSVDPYILYSAFRDWDALTAWWYPQVEKAIELDQAIREKVKQLTDGIKNPLEAAQKLYAFVSREIEYVPIELGVSAWTPYSARDTFQLKYGDSKGKGALLIGMLNEIGLKAHMVLIKRKSAGKFAKEIPSLDFDHALVALEQGDRYLFLEPSVGFLDFGYLTPLSQGVNALVIKGRKSVFEKTPAFPVETNQTVRRVEITNWESETVVQAKIETERTGVQAILPPETGDGEKILEDWVRQSRNQLLVKQAELQLPKQCIPLLTVENRYYPIWFGDPRSEKAIQAIPFPQGYILDRLPKETDLKYAFGSYGRRFRFEGYKLVEEVSISITQDVIRKNQVKDFKKFIETINKEAQEPIVFKKEK